MTARDVAGGGVTARADGAAAARRVGGVTTRADGAAATRRGAA